MDVLPARVESKEVVQSTWVVTFPSCLPVSSVDLTGLSMAVGALKVKVYSQVRPFTALLAVEAMVSGSWTAVAQFISPEYQL